MQQFKSFLLFKSTLVLVTLVNSRKQFFIRIFYLWQIILDFLNF